MSRTAFQTSPLISFSHFPRGTRSYITASLALRSRQQATNHTEVNKHIACLRQDEYSTITPNTVVLMMNECHGNGAFGFDFLNWAFFQTCHSTVIPWSYVGFWSRKRSVWKLQVSEQFFGDAESYYHSHLQWHWSALWLILPMHSVTLIAHSFFIYLFISFGETSGTFDKISPHSPSLNSSGWLLPPAPAVNLYIELFFCLVHGGVG